MTFSFSEFYLAVTVEETLLNIALTALEQKPLPLMKAGGK